MNQVVPWAVLLTLVEPHYPKAGNERRPVGLEIMLRAYFVQRWFNLSDSRLFFRYLFPYGANLALESAFQTQYFWRATQGVLMMMAQK
jgi:hypothetical protein